MPLPSRPRPRPARWLGPLLAIAALVAGASCGARTSIAEGSCGGDLEACAGACVDTGSDEQHCGDCGETCPDGGTCVDGVCQGDPPCPPEGCASCYAPDLACGDVCIDPSTDPDHCGACDRPCAAGARCDGGECVDDESCGEPFSDCGGTCVDTGSDEQHCGGCGSPCGQDEECFEGACACVGDACGECEIPVCGSCGFDGDANAGYGAGTTVGEPNDLAPSCAASSAPESVIRFVAPVTGTYGIGAGPLAVWFDPVLYVLDWASCVELACNDDEAEEVDSYLTVTLQQGQEVAVVVDGFSDHTGEFDLSIVQLE